MHFQIELFKWAVDRLLYKFGKSETLVWMETNGNENVRWPFNQCTASHLNFVFVFVLFSFIVRNSTTKSFQLKRDELNYNHIYAIAIYFNLTLKNSFDIKFFFSITYLRDDAIVVVSLCQYSLWFFFSFRKLMTAYAIHNYLFLDR